MKKLSLLAILLSAFFTSFAQYYIIDSVRLEGIGTLKSIDNSLFIAGTDFNKDYSWYTMKNGIVTYINTPKELKPHSYTLTKNVGPTLYYYSNKQNQVRLTFLSKQYPPTAINTNYTHDFHQTELHPYNNKLYFLNRHDDGNGKYVHLMYYDPATNNISIVKKLDGITSFASLPLQKGNIVYYELETLPSNGIYKIDLNTGNHTHIKDVHSKLFNPMNIMSVDNQILFTDPSSSSSDNELWAYDGNTTRLVTGKNPNFKNNVYISTTYQHSTFSDGHKLYYCAGDTGELPYLSTYTPTTNTITPIVGPQLPNGSPRKYMACVNFTEYNGYLYFTATLDTPVQALFRYDRVNPPELIKRNNTHFEYVKQLQVADGKLYFEVPTRRGYTNLYSIEHPPLSIGKTTIKDVKAVLYPNPTTNNATLEISLKRTVALSVKLTDINGRVVSSTSKQLYSTGKHNIAIKMSHIPPGNYFYSVINNSGALLSTGKIIKR